MTTSTCNKEFSNEALEALEAQVIQNLLTPDDELAQVGDVIKVGLGKFTVTDIGYEYVALTGRFCVGARGEVTLCTYGSKSEPARYSVRKMLTHLWANRFLFVVFAKNPQRVIDEIESYTNWGNRWEWSETRHPKQSKEYGCKKSGDALAITRLHSNYQPTTLGSFTPYSEPKRYKVTYRGKGELNDSEIVGTGYKRQELASHGILASNAVQIQSGVWFGREAFHTEDIDILEVMSL